MFNVVLPVDLRQNIEQYILLLYFTHFSVHRKHLKKLLRQVAGLHHQVFDLVDLEKGMKICISNVFPGNTNSFGLRMEFLGCIPRNEITDTGYPYLPLVPRSILEISFTSLTKLSIRLLTLLKSSER